jgi:hypothetical protein
MAESTKHEIQKLTQVMDQTGGLLTRSFLLLSRLSERCETVGIGLDDIVQDCDREDQKYKLSEVSSFIFEIANILGFVKDALERDQICVSECLRGLSRSGGVIR